MPTPKTNAPEKVTPVTGLAELQTKADAANSKGFSGISPDETPRENYTLAGVTSGKPTPETTRAK